jgi:Na+/melibiose symporter-like transporter
MGFFIILGLIMVVIAIVVKFNTSFTVKENSTCPQNDAKLAKENKINFLIFLIGGITLVLVGIVLSIIL